MPELIQRKNFDSPDERDTPWDKVHGDWVELLGEEIGRTTVETRVDVARARGTGRRHRAV